MENNISILLGLKDAIVKNVEENDRELFIHIEMPRKMHGCPVCRTAADQVHD